MYPELQVWPEKSHPRARCPVAHGATRPSEEPVSRHGGPVLPGTAAAAEGGGEAASPTLRCQVGAFVCTSITGAAFDFSRDRVSGLQQMAFSR